MGLRGAVVWALAGFAAGVSMLPLEPSLGEEGGMIHLAQRLLDGERLYRDIFWFTGPLPFDVLALLFRIFGEEIGVAGLPNTSVAATYTVTYSVQDTAGNSAQVQRTVIVRAPAPPPSSGGGGGSIGLADLLLLTIFGCVAGLGRRRAGPNGRPCTSTANRRNS